METSKNPLDGAILLSAGLRDTKPIHRYRPTLALGTVLGTVDGPPREIAQKVHGRKPPGRNEKCPCNSGKKYKHCCRLTGGVTVSRV